MTDVRANKPAKELAIAVPATLEAALDPEWLSQALGSRVTSVEQVELIKTVATKVRFAVTFESSDEKQAFCLKGLLDVDEMTARGGPTCVLEADFYCKVAPTVDVRVPECVAAVVDREALDRGQFKSQGGFNRINKVFEGKLEAVLGDLHEALWQAAA